jgi:integrase
LFLKEKMMTQKLTKRYVESIEPVEDKELLIWDAEVKGFGIRVFPSGRRTYFVQYRNQAARTRRQKIGQHGVITADMAREEAKKILGDVCKGDDPSALRKANKNMPTFAEFTKNYIPYAKNDKKEKTCKEELKLLNTVLLKRFGNYPLDKITVRDFQQLHHEYRDRIYQGNAIRSLLHRMYNLAIEWDIVQINPVTKIKKYRTEKRNRWMRDDEIKQLHRVLETYREPKIANFIRLLLMTGARKSEALQATWDQIDFKEAVWTKPTHNTKQAKTEHSPLSPQAVKLLKKMKEESDDNSFLFPGKIPGQHLKEPKKAWATIRKKAGLEGVRIHDIRHTYASHLASAGLSLSIIGKLLGHTQVSTTQRYAHLADESLRKATTDFGNKLETLMSEEG